MTVPFGEPLTVVRFDELPNHLSRFLDRLEVVQVQTLLLQRPNPTLHDPVPPPLGVVGEFVALAMDADWHASERATSPVANS